MVQWYGGMSHELSIVTMVVQAVGMARVGHLLDRFELGDLENES